MGLGGVLRGVVPVIKGIIGGSDGLMDVVTIRFWIQDTTLQGDAEYSDPIPFDAVVERKQQMVKDREGQDIMTKHYLTFVEALAPRGTGHGREEPLDSRDIITLSDGTTGPTLTDVGIMDRKTSAPFVTEVYLG